MRRITSGSPIVAIRRRRPPQDLQARTSNSNTRRRRSDHQLGTASARSSYTVLQQTDALALQPIICGRYHDTFQRIDGRWWFATRTMFVDLVGDLSHHLLRELSTDGA